MYPDFNGDLIELSSNLRFDSVRSFHRRIKIRDVIVYLCTRLTQNTVPEYKCLTIDDLVYLFEKQIPLLGPGQSYHKLPHLMVRFSWIVYFTCIRKSPLQVWSNSVWWSFKRGTTPLRVSRIRKTYTTLENIILVLSKQYKCSELAKHTQIIAFQSTKDWALRCPQIFFVVEIIRL